MKTNKVIKLMVSGLSVIALSACSLLPEKKIYTEIDINTPKQIIWDILIDNQAYPQWNPYHVKVEGDLQLGQILKLEIHKPNKSVVHIEPHVMEIKPLQRLIWGGGIEGIFYGKHVFELLSLREGVTRLVHKERFSGIAIPFAELGSIEEGYNLMNEALKKRAEAQYD